MSNDESESSNDNTYVVLGDVADSASEQSWSHVSDTSHGEGSSSSWVDAAVVDEAADSGCRDEVAETDVSVSRLAGSGVTPDAVAEAQSTQEQTRARLSKLSLQDNELPTDSSSPPQESPLATPDTKPAASACATQETTATSNQADAVLTAEPSLQVEDFDTALVYAAEANCPLLAFLASDDMTSLLVQQVIIGTERFQNLLNVGFVFWQTSETTHREDFAGQFGVQKYPCLAAIHPRDGYCIYKMEGSMDEIPWELDHIVHFFSELRFDLFPETPPNGLPNAPPTQNGDLPNSTVDGIDDDKAASGDDGSWKRQRSPPDSKPPGKTTSQPDSTAESDSESGASVKRIKTATIPSLADLKWQGTYDEALSFAKSVHRTLLVSLQDYSQPGSHMVDQHILFKEQIRDIIQFKFVFWQVERNTMEGAKYARHMHAQSCPYIAVIHPNHGTSIWGKHGWNSHHPWDVEEVAQMLTDICYERYAEEQLAMPIDFGDHEYNKEKHGGVRRVTGLAPVHHQEGAIIDMDRIEQMHSESLSMTGESPRQVLRDTRRRTVRLSRAGRPSSRQHGNDTSPPRPTRPRRLKRADSPPTRLLRPRRPPRANTSPTRPARPRRPNHRARLMEGNGNLQPRDALEDK